MKKKLFRIISAISLSLIMVLSIVISQALNSKSNSETLSVQTRTIEASSQTLDFESVFNEYEDAKLETDGSLTTFEGVKTFSLSDLIDIDLVSDANIEEDEIKIKYHYSYDYETGVVTLSATSDQNEGETIDEIVGLAFWNDNLEMDAVFEIDGEMVLLSELQDYGMIENCGLFSRIFKAVVKVVAVAAVAAVVVASCGAGMAAVVAAGAIAGGVTGAIAGGVISKEETGSVQIWAVVGGLIGGAILGGLTGWAVGSIMGVGSSKMSVGFSKGSFKTSKECLEYHFKKHGAEVGAKSLAQYEKLAAETAQKVVQNGIKATRAVSGATPNVFRYEIGKFYIHMAKTAKEIIIVSFGAL
ncbi:MAG: hypothetical protein IJS74_03315 [Clostridia bacterium]|nr:hypothetical protein [Clostridia bacterium]